MGKKYDIELITRGTSKANSKSKVSASSGSRFKIGTPNIRRKNKAPKLFGDVSRSQDTNDKSYDWLNISADSEYIYIQAEYLLEMLAKRTLSISLLSAEQKIIIFLYLYKYNSKIGRIIELFVNIPLSGLELRYPDNIENPILMDFVKDFFDRMWERSKIPQALYKIYRDYKLLGFGAMLVSDDFTLSTTVDSPKGVRKETIIDFDDVENSLKHFAKSKLSEEDKKDVEEITKRYEKDPDSVSTEDLQKVVYSYIPNFQEPKLVGLKEDESWLELYRGLKYVKNLDPFELLNRRGNKDINFYSYTLNPDPSIANVEDIEENSLLKAMESIGYSKSYVTIFGENQVIELNSYPYTDSNLWVAHLENENSYSAYDKSLLNRVLDHAIDIEVVKKSNRIKSLRAYKNIYLMSSEVTGDNFDVIDGLIHEAVNKDESSYIFTNKPISVENISFDTRETLDLDGLMNKAEDDLINGLGMVDTLTGSADSYANSYLKLEMLGNQFTQERMTLANMIEEQILKPIAIKKGLVTKDRWGHIQPIYPRVSFDRINFARSTEDFQMLLSLAENGKIPYSYILKALNFHPQEIQREIVKEQSTVYNEEVKGFVTRKLLENEEFGKFVMRDKGHITSLLKALNIETDGAMLNTLIKEMSREGDNIIKDKDALEDLANDLYEKYQEDHPEEETTEMSIDEGDRELTLKESVMSKKERLRQKLSILKSAKIEKSGKNIKKKEKESD